MNDSVLRIIFGQMCAAFFFLFCFLLLHFMHKCVFIWAHSIHVIISALHRFRSDMWIICWLTFTERLTSANICFKSISRDLFLFVFLIVAQVHLSEFLPEMVMSANP